MTECWTYRGYQIEPRREWSQWCVLILSHALRFADLAAINLADSHAAKG
jgi:hypothetical protein